MRRNSTGLLTIGLLILALATPVLAQVETDTVATWDFDVYLDDKRVGKHLFSVSETGDKKQVTSDASFTVKVLFIPVYQYEHSAAERWTDNCLAQIDASTNANGKEIAVSGEKTVAGFVLETGDSPVELPECIMTFAYWNPEFLDQPRLLNPQTGDYVDVSVEKVGNEILEVRGQPVPARRFKLTAREVDLTLWYSPDDEWLALESVAKGGRIIRYELS